MENLRESRRAHDRRFDLRGNERDPAAPDDVLAAAAVDQMAVAVNQFKANKQELAAHLERVRLNCSSGMVDPLVRPGIALERLASVGVQFENTAAIGNIEVS